MAGRSFGTEVSSIAGWRCFGRGNEEANGELADAKSSPRVTGNRPDDDAGKRKDCWNIAGKDGPACRVARYLVRYHRQSQAPPLPGCDSGGKFTKSPDNHADNRVTRGFAGDNYR